MVFLYVSRQNPLITIFLWWHSTLVNLQISSPIGIRNLERVCSVSGHPFIFHLLQVWVLPRISTTTKGREAWKKTTSQQFIPPNPSRIVDERRRNPNPRAQKSRAWGARTIAAALLISIRSVVGAIQHRPHTTIPSFVASSVHSQLLYINAYSAKTVKYAAGGDPQIKSAKFHFSGISLTLFL